MTAPPGPTSHPRLLFTADELPALRQAALTGLRRRILDRLVEICRHLIDPGSPTYLDFRERRHDRWRQRKGIFHVHPSMRALATAYVFTGEAAFGEAARDCLVAIMEHGLADVPATAYGDKTQGWRHGPGHDKGNIAQACAYVYDFCHDLFSPDQRRQFADYARQSIAYADEFIRSDIDQIANNRGIRGLSVRRWMHLVLEGEADLGEDPAKVWYGGLYQLDTHLFHAFDDQGAPYEGPGYAMSIMAITALAESLRRRTGVNLLNNNRFERLPQYLLYELVPGGGSANNLNDADTPCGRATAFLPLMGTPRGELLPWLARQLDLHPSREAEWLDGPPREGMGGELLYYLLWWRDDATVRTPAELGYPKSNCFRTRGVASMRTGWEKDAWLVSHFCGRQERRCHRQADYNHVSFYAAGEYFLADAGYGDLAGPQKDGITPVNRWYMATDAHNCVMIDGHQFCDVFNTPGWGEGVMLDFQHRDELDTSLGDASACIGPDHSVRRAMRRVVMVRRPTPFLAVIDLNEKDGSDFEACLQWQTLPGHRIELAAGGFVLRGSERDCRTWVFSPQDLGYEIGDTVGMPHVRIRAKAPVVETVSVFWPMEKGESPEFACRRVQEGGWEITCRRNGQTSVLTASATVNGPLRKPEEVTLAV